MPESASTAHPSEGVCSIAAILYKLVNFKSHPSVKRPDQEHAEDKAQAADEIQHLPAQHMNYRALPTPLMQSGD